MLAGKNTRKMSWRSRLIEAWKDLGTELKILHKQPVFLANAWGFVPVQACLGVFTFWGPKVTLVDNTVWIMLCSPTVSALLSVSLAEMSVLVTKCAVVVQAAKDILRADEEVVSYLLGGITVGTAVVGTLGGGVPLVLSCGHADRSLVE